MKLSDEKEFNQIIIGLAEIFGKEVTDTFLRLYFGALEDLEIEYIRKTANVLARTCKFFPKPVEFREALQPNLEVQASLAYEKVERAFRRVGIYSSVIFDDPVIHAVLRSLGGDKGWIEYCNLKHDEVKWWRKDFERLYKNYAPLVARGEITPPHALGGLWESNERATQEAREPVRIGDPDKFKVLWGGIQKYLPTTE